MTHAMQHGAAAVYSDSSATVSPILEARNLRKVFPVGGGSLFGRQQTVKALEDFSVCLRPGYTTALVGESGSGKTTAARILAGMYQATSGDILFSGVSSRNMPGGLQSRKYHQHVQLIFQDPFASLNAAHSIRYHLARPLQIYHKARTKTDLEIEILALLQRVSLTPAEQFIQKLPHELSGGQRQRVAIARALAPKPSVLLADEPVSMLDVSIRLDILNLLTRLKDEENLALLYITHDIASARYFADTILVMYAGQSIESGPSEALIKEPKHPYTQLLLSAAPDPARNSVEPLIGKGESPSLINPPAGCRFHPRCPFAKDICRTGFPKRTEIQKDHWVNCFLYTDALETASSDIPAPAAP